MNFSLNHLNDLKDLYINQEKCVPLCISDWHCDDAGLIVPEFIRDVASKTSKKEHAKYQFADELDFTKSNIIRYLKYSASINIDESNITFTSTATAALNLLAVSLTEMNVKRLLVMTPVYFSFIDAARRAGLEIIYYHHNPTLRSDIDYQAIADLIKSQYADALYVTRPLYTCGKEFPDDALREMTNTCNNCGIWMICDSTLSGLNWNGKAEHSFDANAIKILSSSSKFALVESPPKKMFMNGLKFGLVYGSPDIIRLIDSLANTYVGGLMGVQVKFVSMFFSKDGEAESITAIEANGKALARKRTALLDLTAGTPFDILDVDSGNFGIIIDNSSKLREVNLSEIARKMLWERNLWAHPLSKFCFFEECKAGFRINYGKNLEDLKSGVSSIVKSYPNGLKFT